MMMLMIYLLGHFKRSNQRSFECPAISQRTKRSIDSSTGTIPCLFHEKFTLYACPSQMGGIWIENRCHSPRFRGIDWPKSPRSFEDDLFLQGQEKNVDKKRWICPCHRPVIRSLALSSIILKCGGDEDGNGGGQVFKDTLLDQQQWPKFINVLEDQGNCGIPFSLATNTCSQITETDKEAGHWEIARN